MRLDELAEALGVEFEGEASAEISGLCSAEQPRAGHLGFATSARFLALFARADCLVAVLTKPAWRAQLSESPESSEKLSFLLSDSPYDSFVDAMGLFHPERAPAPGIHATAVIDDAASIGKEATVGAYAVIEKDTEIGEGAVIGPGCHIEEGARIGAGTVLDAHVVVHHHCQIGERCRLHASCVIGSEGFGHIERPDKSWRRIPHQGTVIIGDDVRIGAGCTIDRGVVDATTIESGVKLDNLVHIGHNALIGADTAMAAGALIAGHAHIGRASRLAGNVAVNGVRIAEGTTVLGATSISKDIREPGTTVAGHMGFLPARRWFRWLARLRKLEERPGSPASGVDDE